MNRPLSSVARALLGLLLCTPALAQDEIIRGEIPPMPEPTYHPEPAGITVETFADDLEVVWSIVFDPDGRAFITERPGRVRILSADGSRPADPWLDITDRAFFMGESGLTGLALHPDYPEQPWVYVMYTHETEDGPLNRISRFRDEGERAGEEDILLDGLPAQRRGGSHSGGTLEFDPDGMLLAATGDAFERQRSDDLDDPAGAVLRLTPEGEVPADNPWPGNPIWAHGLRNVHGLTWQPGTGNLFAGDHGPTGEDRLFGHDRILILEEGAHHGWPVMIGAAGMEGYVDPILTFNPSMPPGDLRFYTGDLLPDLRGDLFMSVLGFTPEHRQLLQRFRFGDESDPTRVTAVERWFHDGEGSSTYGRLRALAVGPDGALYVGTSNHDGRQATERHRERPDRILRITPMD